MNWRELSAVVFGEAMKGNISKNRLRPEIFHSPYNEGIEALGDNTSLMKILGLDAYQSAEYAGQLVNGTGPEIDWVRSLEEAHANAVSAKTFRRFADKLEKNEDIDWSEVNDAIARNQSLLGETFTTLDRVNHEIPLWMKSGVKFFDYWTGGLPEVGVVNIAGRPKVGKTTLVMGLARKWVKANPNRQVAIFTLEMLSSQFKARFMQLYPDISEEEMKRIHITDMPVNPHQAISAAAAIPDLGLVILDFADLMVDGEIAEAQMSSLYRTLATGAKKLNACFVLLSQLSRSYSGGIPRPNHVRYTGLAEALVVLNYMLYVPWNDYFELKDQDTLPVMDGYGYIIRWFSRFETAQHAGFPGAISVPFSGKEGWDLDAQGKWHTLEKFS